MMNSLEHIILRDLGVYQCWCCTSENSVYFLHDESIRCWTLLCRACIMDESFVNFSDIKGYELIPSTRPWDFFLNDEIRKSRK